MVVNQIGNQNIVDGITRDALNMLVGNNVLDDEEKGNPIDFEIGYVFSGENGALESLFKITTCKRPFYFVIMNGAVVNVRYTDEQYQSIVNDMKSKHPELTVVPEVTESEIQINRKNRNNNFLAQQGIIQCPLKCRYDNMANLKSIDDICKRAIACLIVIQASCDYRNNNFQAHGFYLTTLNQYGVIEYLNPKEARILSSDRSYSEQDLIDMDWAYEAYWALCWVLGLVNDISNASQICDCDYAIKLVFDPLKNPDKAGMFKKMTPYETFRNRCHLRNINEILDMEDLYFRYHWAVHEKSLRPETNIGNLDSSIVLERRRALIWVLSNLTDWYDVDFST